MNSKKIVSALCAVLTGAAIAQTTPVMVSLVSPVQIPSSDFDVAGFRLSLIYGSCQEFAGVDIGIAQCAAGDFTGIAFGGVNISGERLIGAQIGLVNWNGGVAESWEMRSTGAQIGFLNYAGSFCGLQDGLVNITGGAFAGLQSAFINYSGDCYGVQCGYNLLFGVNIATGRVRGCQIGLINYAYDMDSGLQIGLVNIIANNGWLPVLPIVNGHF